MIHIALRVAYVLFLAWLGLDVLLLIVLCAVMFFRRQSTWPDMEAQRILNEADVFSTTDGRTIAPASPPRADHVSTARLPA
jgi:hypothetical protein